MLVTNRPDGYSVLSSGMYTRSAMCASVLPSSPPFMIQNADCFR